MRHARAPSSGRRRIVATTSCCFFCMHTTGTMASFRARTLPSDPEYLLAFMSQLGDESDSEDEFDRWLNEDDGPQVVRERCTDNVEDSPASIQQRSVSLNSLDLAYERPLAELSPTHSPMLLSRTSSPQQLQPTSPSHSSLMQLGSPSHSSLVQPTAGQPEHPTAPTSHQNPTNSNHATLSSQPSRPVFTADAGVRLDTDGMSPVDFFCLMFDERVFDLIFTETRRYANQYLEREREHLATHPNARAHEWGKTQLTIKEIEAFIAILIAVGICGLPTLRYIFI